MVLHADQYRGTGILLGLGHAVKAHLNWARWVSWSDSCNRPGRRYVGRQPKWLPSRRGKPYEARKRHQVLVNLAVRRVRGVMAGLFLLTIVLAGQAAVRPF